MTRLAQELQKYYIRQGKRVVFHNGQSLNQLALAMWERLDCTGVDASVLSRVLKGERLFTAQQLKTFCILLNIPNDEEQRLFECLAQDSNARLKPTLAMVSITNPLALEAITELAGNSSHLFYRGDYATLHSNYELVRQLISAYSLNGTLNKQTAEAFGLCIYMFGRTISSSELPNLVIGKITPLFHRLIAYGNDYHSSVLYGYAHTLLSNAYYGAGGYLSTPVKSRLYATSIKHARIAIDNLPVDNHERLFAFRTLAASANYLGDQAAIRYVLDQTKHSLTQQPDVNHINAIHLSTTLSKCLANSGAANPFWIQDLTQRHFNRDLRNTGVYEISTIKEKIETVLLLKSHDMNYVRDRAKEGLKLATTLHLNRHTKYFNQLLHST